MDTMSVLRLMPSKTEEIARFSKSIIESVQSGDTNALEVLVMLRAFAKASEAILDCIEPNILTAAEKYSEKNFELFGAKLEKAELGTKYAYDKTGDTLYEMLKVEADKANKLLKERQEFLKAVKVPTTFVDEFTGEIVRINPPTKTSTSGIKVTLK